MLILFDVSKTGLIALFTLSLTILTIKTVNVEKIEDTDEYLKIRETIIHEKIKRILSCVDIAINVPRYVATPFPPLNFSHSGNKCPKKVIKAESWTNSGK